MKKVNVKVEKLLDIMLEKELSIPDLTASTGISGRSFQRLQSEHQTSFPNLCAIAYILKVDPLTLIA